MILVTGGMGFIGVHTARALLDAGRDVVVTRHRTWRLPPFLEAEHGRRLHVEAVDLQDGLGVLDLMRRRRVDSVVHLAVPALGTAPAQELASALGGLVSVLEAGRMFEVRRVTLASSLAVYGGAGPGPWRECDPLPVQSDSHTGAVKKAVEVLGLHFADRTGLDVVVLRLAAMYGPLYHSMANLPSRLCHAAVAGARPDLDGVRGGPPAPDAGSDLCYVRDCAAGIRLLHLGERLGHRVYNVGAGRRVANREVAAAVELAVPGARVALPEAICPAGSATAYMDTTRAREDVGYAPAYDIGAGVADYVAWLRDHPQ